MKVLLACEESQAVTIAMRNLGIEAFSCDLQECSGGHPEWHLQEDVLPLLDEEWDLIIAFPPCTHLSVSGAPSHAEKYLDGRQQEAIDFFMSFTDVRCPKVAIENPVSIMSSLYRKPDQIIQPYMFGHLARKTTCLWLKGLPKLVPTNNVKDTFMRLPDHYDFGPHKHVLEDLPPSPNRGKLRSKFFQGVADAMAAQWGRPISDLEILLD